MLFLVYNIHPTKKSCHCTLIKQDYPVYSEDAIFESEETGKGEMVSETFAQMGGD